MRREDLPRRELKPAPTFLPGEFYGQRSLVKYSPWGCKESDTTEQLTYTHTHTHKEIKEGMIAMSHQIQSINEEKL